MNITAIRIKCAELVGWTNVREPIGPSGQIGTWWGDKQMGQWNTQHQIPNYPESADAALELVAWMEKEGWELMADNLNLKGQVKPRWHLSFHKVGCPLASAAADTFPLALCLAFLRASGIDPETL